MGAPVRERWSAVTSRVDRLRMCEAVSEKAQAPSSLPPLRTQPQAVRCQPDSTSPAAGEQCDQSLLPPRLPSTTGLYTQTPAADSLPALENEDAHRGDPLLARVE
jgi:hypothetical protein